MVLRKLVEAKRAMGKSGRPTTMWKGDNGKWYEDSELGELFGISKGSIRNRINRHGYEYEHLFVSEVPRGLRMDGTKVNRLPEEGGFGNAEFRALSGKPRNGRRKW